MMALPQSQQNRYTYEQYLELERQTGVRYTYYYGEVFNLAGGSKRHNLLALNICFALSQLYPDCQVFASDVKLQLEAKKYYVYPDVVVTCHKDDLENDEEAFIQHPSIIVEVLSDSTSDYDKKGKKERYIQLASLQHYILVHQDKPYIEVYKRLEDGWLYKIWKNADDMIQLSDTQHFSLATIYNKITFPTPEQDTENPTSTTL